jgi:hypothetical protein
MALLLQRSSTSLTTRALSRNAASPDKPSYARNASNPSTPKSDKSKDDVQLPGFSLKNLGMSPGIKLVVYGVLAVIGTAETITYGSWAYSKLYPSDGPKKES